MTTFEDDARASLREKTEALGYTPGVSVVIACGERGMYRRVGLISSIYPNGSINVVFDDGRSGGDGVTPDRVVCIVPKWERAA